MWSRTPAPAAGDLTRFLARCRDDFPRSPCHLPFDLPPQGEKLLTKASTELDAKQSRRRELQPETCFNPGGDQSLWMDEFIETFDCDCLANVVEECGS